MPRPVKWSRDLHSIRERAQRAKTETWARQDSERLFGISWPSAQNLMKAIGEVKSVGAADFVERASLLSFLNEMIEADSVEAGLRDRLAAASPVPPKRPYRFSLPIDLHQPSVRDLPPSVQLNPGELRIIGDCAEQIVEGLLALAQVMRWDLEAVRLRLEATREKQVDIELQTWFASIRSLD